MSLIFYFWVLDTLLKSPDRGRLKAPFSMCAFPLVAHRFPPLLLFLPFLF